MRGCWRQSGTGGGDIRMKFIEEHCVLLVVLAKVHPETRGEAVKRKSGKVKERYGKALLQVLEGGLIHEQRVLRDVIVTGGEPGSLLSHHLLSPSCCCSICPVCALPALSSSVSVLNRKYNILLLLLGVVVVVAVQIHKSLLETMGTESKGKVVVDHHQGASISAFHPREASP